VNAYFSNVSMEELIDPDGDSFEELAEYVKKPFRAFSLNDCFSLMVIPGFLEDIPNVDKFAKLAEENKVHVFTDLPDFESYEEADEQMNGPALEGMAGSTPEKAHLSVAARSPPTGYWADRKTSMKRKICGFPRHRFWPAWYTNRTILWACSNLARDTSTARPIR
jgi:hypothetical protein